MGQIDHTISPSSVSPDTIAAISTPPGTGGIAVVRLSGSRALEIADSVWRGKSLSKAESHTAHLGEIIDARGEMLDQALATVFAPGRSFTGEATVEFSIHGSRWLQQEVLATLIAAGARMAGPGEFSQRAVINGRMDLTQAEGVADLIAASSRAAHRLATRQMKGQFSARLDTLRQQMIELASLIELELDFSEEDVEFADRGHLADICDAAIDEIRRLSDSFRTGRAIRDGVAVVIAGQPNAGKSTLLNALLQDDKAIVSDIPGTTRDIIEDTAEIDGILYRFIDTAGLREASDAIERIGIDRARKRLQSADIILWLYDPTSPLPPQRAQARQILEAANPTAPVIPLLTKADLAAQSAQSAPSDPSDLSDLSDPSDLSYSSDSSDLSDQSDKRTPIELTISANTGQGLDKLRQTLKSHAESGHDLTQELLVTNLRHYQALTAALHPLQRVSQALRPTPTPSTSTPTSSTTTPSTSTTTPSSRYPTNPTRYAINPSAFIAQDLREAIHHLSQITGAITTETLLTTIFSRFCIGK